MNFLNYSSILVVLLFLHVFFAFENVLNFFSETMLAYLLYVLILMCIVMASHTKHVMSILLISTIPTAVVEFIGYNEHLFSWVIVSRVSAVFVIFATIWIILRDILHQRVVNQNTIAGALCAYMLIGVAFGRIFVILELFAPGSFSGLPVTDFSGHGYVDVAEAIYKHMQYYSFITLTTLGYGNISPVTQVASAFASLEAIIGQIFLTVLVAKLVGIFIVNEIEDKNNKPS